MKSTKQISTSAVKPCTYTREGRVTWELEAIKKKEKKGLFTIEKEPGFHGTLQHERQNLSI